MRTYGEFADAIVNVPVPKDIDEETLKAVKGQVTTMAKPIRDQADQWHGQAAALVAKLPPEEQPRAKTAYLNSQWRFDFEPSAAASSAHLVADNKNIFDWKPLLNKLKEDPYASQPLEELKKHFETTGQRRLAAYFQGRLQGVKETQDSKTD